MKYSYGKIRARAKERGHSFTLTFEDYERFSVNTGYAELKGKTKHSLSIHRKDNSRGYHADNIAAITLSLNSRLQWANIPAWMKDEMLAAEQASLAEQRN